MNNIQRIIGKNALILVAKGKKEIASQIFVYDHIREIRVDTEEFEVKILMDYDDSYFRVLKVNLNEKISEKEALKISLDFYNNLLNASMKLSKEEMESFKNQRINQIKKFKELSEKNTKEKSDNEEK